MADAPRSSGDLAHELTSSLSALLLGLQRLRTLTGGPERDKALALLDRMETTVNGVAALLDSLRAPPAAAPPGGSPSRGDGPDPMTATPERRAFSVAVFCRNAGAVLLVRHRRLGTWLPVGGEIERGETPLEAARRELREETGLEGAFPSGLGVDGTPPGLIGYEEHLAGSKGLHLNFAFVADVASRHLVACDEWDGARWVTAPELAAVECPRNVRELAAMALASRSG